MDSDYSYSSEPDEGKNKSTTKKRKKTGRMKDVMKVLRAESHELGPDCSCKKLRCFETVLEDERKRIIREFNALGDNDKQNSYLGGLITVLPVRRRGSKEDQMRFNTASFAYRVLVMRDGVARDVRVCLKAFMSMHGISEDKVRYIRNALVATGKSPTDKRGKHSNRPHKLTEETLATMYTFLKSLKGRKSHYSLKDTQKTYLSEELNIAKLHAMYLAQNPGNEVSYESFREFFQSKFNISFGYPRKDTCSTCDSLKSEICAFMEKLKSSSDPHTLEKTAQDLQSKEKERELHLKKSERFYELKKSFRKKSVKSSTIEAVTMDFQKNLPCPNITTNDVYYRRQLNFISFNIHILSNQQAIFYTYDESIAKKGADEVCSMFNHFVCNILPPEVKELAIFCDSCAGQNKNFTFIRFLHYLVTKKGRFDTIKVVFPIRGHSYLECDRNMSIVKQSSYTETPDDWREVLRNTRVKPCPFEVIDCGKDFSFQNWTEYLSSIYPEKCPFPTRQIRMLKISGQNKRLVYHKPSYFGTYLSSPLEKPPPNKRSKKKKPQNSSVAVQLQNSYNMKLPIKAAKYRDLLHLTQFLEKPEAKMFYKNLNSDDLPGDGDDNCIDDPPIDAENSGEEQG